MGCNTVLSSCNSCCVKSSRLLTICIRDNYNLLWETGLFQNLKICDTYSCCLVKICEKCLLKAGIFNKISMGCLQETTYRINTYDRMQDKPSPTQPEVHSPKEDCDCENCQKNFIGLNLLANVIESVQKSPEILKRKEEKSDESDKIKRFKSEEVPEKSTSEKFTSKYQQVSVIQKVEVPQIQSLCVELPKTENLSEPSTSGFSGKVPSKTIKIMNCEHCQKTFTHRGDLNKHLRSHTGEQPFVCPVCQRRFTHTSNLQRHLRVHSGDKPFRCERCNRDFGRKDKLLLHQKTKLCMKHSQQNQ